jgi:hypothetical protein
MKLIAGVLLLVFTSSAQSVVLNCIFYMNNRGTTAGLVYECFSHAENTGNSTFIEEVLGTHLEGKGNADVECYFEGGDSLTSIPRNLASFYPNLKDFFIYAPILHLSSSDLKPFPNLIRFQSHNGQFTNIEGDLFQYTRQLQHLQLTVPGLKSVGANLLTGLKDLVYVYFGFGECIGTFQAETPERIQELKQTLLIKCPPLERQTTSSPTTTSNSV